MRANADLDLATLSSGDELLDLLADPTTFEPLDVDAGAGGSFVTAFLGSKGARYPVTNGIPRFVQDSGSEQAQTADAFGFKWSRTATYNSSSMRRSATTWLLRRYQFESPEHMRSYLEARAPVVDVGCGSGYSTSLWFDGWGTSAFVGLDISAAVDLAKERLGAATGAKFIQGDALHLPFRSGSFGAVISEGVLHHTPSTRSAILSAARILRPGGELLFYVYRRKSPLREYADDYIRAQLAPLSNEAAWAAMESITHLGKALADLRAVVDVPVDVDLLGIPAGSIDVQRLIYWHIAKLFWNDDYSFDENVHVNFDWYRPAFAHRQTEEEVRAWCDEAGLDIFHFDSDPAGFTVRSIRRSVAPTSSLK